MKQFLKNHGLWILFAAAVIAVAMACMSYFSNTSSPLSNLAGTLASPFRAVYSAVTGWVEDKQAYFADVKALEEELGHIIYTSPLTQYNGALGAALFAYQKYLKEQKG